MNPIPRKFIATSLLVTAMLATSGCGLLLGRVKPVDEKSEEYGIMDLSREKPEEWTRLDPEMVAASSEKEKDTSSSEISDAAYQSRKTASTISINSACRPPSATEQQNLRNVTNLLFLGLTDVTLRAEKEVEIQGNPALETTVRGRLPLSASTKKNKEKSEEVMLKTVVVKKGGCIYDLVYLSPPQHFQTNLGDFTQFVASLRLR